MDEAATIPTDDGKTMEEGGETMTSICPDCGKDSLMMGNIGMMFGITPYCANIHCPSQEVGDE
jgi:hypothetical protein|tara:strand:- start:121 stop:309 length:189 start_codon:yes stop_codon:yes gene_type:complete